ncbi:MAG: regulator of cell morphosis and signaling [Herminiimonas sp.]|jgi:hemerythrin superfamily protein|nr:regulator of cell morphosis and signaling [Herminiimonas sp.]
MNAVELLISQHRTMEILLKGVLDAPDDASKNRMFAEAADQLTVHIASEEQVFYPAVKAARTEDILLESLEEHLSLKRLLADLLELNPSEQTFEPKFKVLKEQAEHHHEEEEEKLFPKVRKLLDEERLEALGREMIEMQTQLKLKGEPRAQVSNETGTAAPLK